MCSETCRENRHAIERDGEAMQLMKPVCMLQMCLYSIADSSILDGTVSISMLIAACARKTGECMCVCEHRVH